MISPSIERALVVALAAHEGQFRKGDGRTPYVVHPLHAAIAIARLGGSEIEIQAALLHDVVEDCPSWTAERLEREFGARVAGIVAELTEDKSRPWVERKEASIESVPRLSPEAARVLAMEKLHNWMCLAAELRGAADPGRVWSAFRGGRDETLRVARELADALGARLEPALADRLRRAVAELG